MADSALAKAMACAALRAARTAACSPGDRSTGPMEVNNMSNSRIPRACRLWLLVLAGAAMTACHFHGPGHCGGHYQPVVRVCR